MIEYLLQENNLTLAKIISMCRSREASKKHCSNIHVPGLGMVAAYHQRSQAPTQMCSGCGSNIHKDGCRQCPAYNQVCMSCQKVVHFAKVYRSRGVRQYPGNTLQLPQPRSSPSQQYCGTTQELAVPQLQTCVNAIQVQS